MIKLREYNVKDWSQIEDDAQVILDQWQMP